MNHFVILMLVLTALCYVALALTATLKKPVTPSARFYSAMVALAAIWAFTCAIELHADTLSTKMLLMQIRLMFICFIPYTWLGLVLSLTGRLYAFRKLFLFLLIVPALTAILALTTRMHEQFRFDFSVELVNELRLLTFKRSAWDTLHEISNHFVSLLGFFFLLSAWHSSSGPLRKQVVLLGISFVIPLTANLLFITNIFPSIGINPTPLILLPSSLLQGWVVLRTSLLDIVPVARSQVLQQIDIGIIVLDQNRKIADINRAALKEIGLTEATTIGRVLADLDAPWNTLDSITQEPQILPVQRNNSSLWFRIEQKQITTSKNTGSLLLIKEITSEIMSRRKADVERAYQEKENQQRLQRLLLRDIHDGLGGLTSNLALMSVLASKETDPEKKVDWLKKIEHTANETNTEIRDLMNALENTSMSWGDLILSLRRTAGTLFNPETTALTFTLGHIPEGENMGLTEGMSLLRMVRECFNNIVKHAQANQVCVQIDILSDRLTIIISDNGIGFEPDRITPGRGLKNLQARVAELGGTITTRSDNGTCQTIQLRVPVRIVSSSSRRENHENNYR